MKKELSLKFFVIFVFIFLMGLYVTYRANEFFQIRKAEPPANKATIPNSDKLYMASSKSAQIISKDKLPSKTTDSKSSLNAEPKKKEKIMGGSKSMNLLEFEDIDETLNRLFEKEEKFYKKIDLRQPPIQP